MAGWQIGGLARDGKLDVLRLNHNWITFHIVLLAALLDIDLAQLFLGEGDHLEGARTYTEALSDVLRRRRYRANCARWLIPSTIIWHGVWPSGNIGRGHRHLALGGQ